MSRMSTKINNALNTKNVWGKCAQKQTSVYHLTTFSFSIIEVGAREIRANKFQNFNKIEI